MDKVILLTYDQNVGFTVSLNIIYVTHKIAGGFVLQLIHVEAIYLKLGSPNENGLLFIVGAYISYGSYIHQLLNRLDCHSFDPDLVCHRGQKSQIDLQAILPSLTYVPIWS